MIFVLLPLGVLIYFAVNAKDTLENSQNFDLGVFGMPKKRLFDMKDIEPSEQGGNYKRDYDLYFEAAADEFGVPFALLKAHAVIESSLNPNAFLDENPQKLKTRTGWASRGLMQILWWPNSNRFAKYGYADKDLGVDGVRMFEPNVNVRIAAQLMKDNLGATRGNLKDTINMYNTGVKYSQRIAPNGYVDKVLKVYTILIGENK